MSDWISNVRCSECNAIHTINFSASHANAFSEKHPCWRCGNTDSGNWRAVTERWLSFSVWWKPWTWGDGEWQRKP